MVLWFPEEIPPVEDEVDHLGAPWLLPAQKEAFCQNCFMK